jgi:hypothetical protein
MDRISTNKTNTCNESQTTKEQNKEIMLKQTIAMDNKTTSLGNFSLIPIVECHLGNGRYPVIIIIIFTEILRNKLISGDKTIQLLDKELLNNAPQIININSSFSRSNEILVSNMNINNDDDDGNAGEGDGNNGNNQGCGVGTQKFRLRLLDF